jgi:REP element-mobilizing transposase RayT
MARGVDGREIFADDADRRTFLALTRSVKNEATCSVLAYCLMGNHFHFAIRVGPIPLSRIMQRILTGYAMAFNFRHDRQGHLFQARYKAIMCLDDSYLIALTRYIHMNPVRSGLVERPEQWPWSSHSEYDQQSLVPPDAEFDAWSDGRAASPLYRDEYPDEKTLDEIASELFPDDVIMIRSATRRREVTRKRLLVAETAILNGHQLSAIADWMGRTPQAIHNLIERNKLN